MKINFLLIAFALLSSSILAQNTDKQNPNKKQNNFSAKEETFSHYWEDFDSGIFPPSNWALISGATSQTWQLADSNIAMPLSGTSFALCRYDQNLTPGGQDEKLITDAINLNGLNDAKLVFWFFFSKYWGISPNDNYDLQVLVSTDGGLNFNDTIWTELSTDTANWNSWDWVKAEVDITNYINLNDVRFCFRYVGFDGADAAIENVGITFLSTDGNLGHKELKLYPNPSSDFIIFDIDENSLVRIFDINGKIVFNQNINSSENKINISNLNEGIYFINIKNSKSENTSRFIKSGK